MKLEMHVEQSFAQLPSLVGRERETGGQISPQDNAPEAFHDVEGRPDHRGVVRVREGSRTVRKDGLERLEHPILPGHVMGSLGLGADRRASENEFAFSDPQEIGEVRISARELKNREASGQVRNGILEKLFHSRNIQVFPRSRNYALVNQIHSLPRDVHGNQASCASQYG